MKKTEELFGTGSIWKAIAKMSIPAVITMLVLVVYNMVDMYFVSKTGDAAQIAAISLASPVFQVQSAFGTLIGGGGCAVISNALGKGNQIKVKASSAACLVMVVISGILLGGTILLFPDFIMSLLGADTDTWQFTKDYVCILAAGMMFSIFSTVFANIIRAEGASKESMIGNAIGTVANMILDPIFILWLGMGVKGAALATVLGNMMAALFYLYYFLKKETALSLHPKYVLSMPAVFGSVLLLGVPSAISNLLAGLTNTISNRILISYGANTVAAVGVGSKASLIVTMVVMGICIGVQPVIAYNYGAGNRKRTIEALLKTSALSLSVGVSLTALCFVFRNTLAALFLEDSSLLAQSVHIMEIHLMLVSFIGLYYIGVNFLQAAGKALLATILSAFRQGIFYVPVILILHQLAGLEGVYYTSVVTDFGAVLLSVSLLLLQMKKGFDNDKGILKEEETSTLTVTE